MKNWWRFLAAFASGDASPNPAVNIILVKQKLFHADAKMNGECNIIEFIPFLFLTLAKFA